MKSILKVHTQFSPITLILLISKCNASRNDKRFLPFISKSLKSYADPLTKISRNLSEPLRCKRPFWSKWRWTDVLFNGRSRF